MKPTVTNCFPCWTKRQRAIPATWACGDDFYCDACLREDKIEISECETIEAWRRSHGQPVHTPEVVEQRAKQSASGRIGGKQTSDIRKAFKVCACGTRLRKGLLQCKACQSAANAGASAPSNSGGATRPTSTPAPQNASKREMRVAGFDVRVISLEEYRSDMPARFGQDILDPVVLFVKAMKAGEVLLIPPGKGTTLHKFRGKLSRALQIRNKVPVTIEMREKHGVLAVIRREARG
jgi:hypothetical protein